MSRTTDRFKDDYSAIETNERQLEELLNDRKTKAKQGEPTGSVNIVYGDHICRLTIN